MNWISVKDQLPEDASQCLVTGREFDMPDGKRFQLVAMFKNKSFHQWVCDESSAGGYWPESDNVYVTHWMPLPEPPKD